MANGYRGRAFLYVLVSAGPEDLLKIGLSHDPLARWSSFHRRWFEAFDLDHSLLVETETRRDAQLLETLWHRRFKLHRCPIPLTLRLAAGGGNEWYRGAYPQAVGLAQRLATEGYVVHFNARQWLQPSMQQQAERMADSVRQALDAYATGMLSPPQSAALRDLLDAHRSFATALIDAVSPCSAAESGCCMA